MDAYTDDALLGFYEAAIGPLHNPTEDWLADALVWIRRIVVAENLTDATSMAVAWTGEAPVEVRVMAEKLRAAAGHEVPVAAPTAPGDPRVVHIKDVEPQHLSKGRHFDSQFRRLSAATGGVKLGCSMYEVKPGKRAFPFHAHYGIEEAIFILAGEGTLRLGETEMVVRGGTYAAFPPGADAAHQIINTGTTVLRYLCLSSGADPEVVIYPDSGKIMAMAGGWPPEVRMVAKQGESLDYWDGEDIG